MAKKKKSSEPLFGDKLPKYSTKSSANRKLSQMGATVKGGRIKFTDEFMNAFGVSAGKNDKTHRELKRAIETAAFYQVSDAISQYEKLVKLAERQKLEARKEYYSNMAETYMDRIQKLTEALNKDKTSRSIIARMSSVSSMSSAVTAAFKAPSAFGSAQISARIVGIMANAFARPINISVEQLNKLESIAAKCGFDLKGRMEDTYNDYVRRHRPNTNLGEAVARIGVADAVFFNSDQFVQNIVDAADAVSQYMNKPNVKFTKEEEEMLNEFWTIYNGLGI